MNLPIRSDEVRMSQGNEAFELRRKRFGEVSISHSAAIFSVPKCGTMLLRNILYMFFEIGAWHEPFVESWTFHEAFARSQQERILCTGHIDFLPETCRLSRSFRRLVLVRDPTDYALAYARFILSNDFQTRSKLGRKIRECEFSLAEAVRFAIVGIQHEGEMIPSISQQFISKAMSWISPETLLVRYEELHAAAGDPRRPKNRAYFENMLAFLGIAVPPDMVERVETGADRSISATARENLTFTFDLEARDRLDADEFRLLEAVAPGLRRALGYC